MPYLILGEDRQQKDLEIANLKTKYLTSPDAKKLDYDILYSNKLDSQALKKSLLALPAVSKARVVLLWDCHDLSAHNKQMIAEFVRSSRQPCVLILESGVLKPGDAFVKEIAPFVELVDFSREEKFNVFNMTRQMTFHKPAQALKILSDLLQRGEHPLRLMGGLVWFWGKMRPKLAPSQYDQGLLFLQEADLNIKRSRLDSRYALEILVVRLCGLL